MFTLELETKAIRRIRCLNSVLNVEALVGAFNQEKALVEAFSVITNLRVAVWTFV